MTLLRDSLLVGLGIVCGLVFAGVAILIWTAFAGPIQEWLCEVLLDKKGGPREQAIGDGGPCSVLISDIHLDTWSYPGDPKIGAFHDFLEWVKGDERVKDLYINGDLMDMPPHPLNQPVVPVLHVKPNLPPPNNYPDLAAYPGLGVLDPAHDGILTELFGLGKPITYLGGNHDLGLYGLRYVRPTLPWAPFKVAWNPAVLLDTAADRRLYIEHGHHQDPLLWLYLRYALLALVQGPESVQRRNKVGMSAKAGIRSAVAVPSGNLEYFELPGNVIPPKGEGFFPRLARYRFRQSARWMFRQVQVDEREKVKALTMGHTHLPDRYEFPGGRLYINSGDWAGNDSHQCFVLIHSNGAVTGPHQWRGAAAAAQLVTGGGAPA